MKKTKMEKGITLVALIITIIVLLILAVVSIRAITGDGILAYAKNARDEYARAQANEASLLDQYMSYLNGGGNVETVEDAVGTMDSNHTITLYSSLPADTYILKYEDANGVMTTYADICSLEAGASYDDFIIQNTAPQSATKIGVYNSSGERVGSVGFTSTFKPNLGNKLYSFGAISDVHTQESGSKEDFQNALTYFNTSQVVDFITICGDLTNQGTDEQLAEYKLCVDTYSPRVPVYAISGNHENALQYSDYSRFEPYTGYPLYYSFTKGNDVFIMVGNRGGSEGVLFTTEELQWLYETLEANKDKRCFVFQHVRPDTTSGNAGNLYEYDCWGGDEATIFESLMSHYPNITHFHGHSHLQFYLQYLEDIANYDNSDGYHSVHIPSITVPRGGTQNNEGYIVDVYENGVILMGRDFTDEKFLPIAQYYLDTTLKTVDAGTYVDSTGTLNTTGEKQTYVNELPLATDADGNIYNGTGYKSNTRWSYSANEEQDYAGAYLSGYIPITTNDIVYLKNIDFIESDGLTCAIIYFEQKGTTFYRRDYGAVDDAIYDSSGTLTQFRANVTGYMRIVAYGLDETSIVSINQPIE